MTNIDKIIIGNSLAIEEVKKLVQAVATTPTTVLIQGETGTGKEVISRALHEFCLLYTSPSPRDNRVSRMPSSA